MRSCITLSLLSTSPSGLLTEISIEFLRLRSFFSFLAFFRSVSAVSSALSADSSKWATGLEDWTSGTSDMSETDPASSEECLNWHFSPFLQPTSLKKKAHGLSLLGLPS